MTAGESDAEELFAEWLEARERGAAPSWSSFLEAHPARRAELEKLWAAWRGVRQLLDGLVEGEFGAGAGEDGLVRFVSESMVATPWPLDQAATAGESGPELAFEPGLRREVVLRRARGSDPEAEGELLREASVLAQLDHPGIPALHDVWRELGGQCVFSASRVGGRRLDEVLDEVMERSLTARIELWLRVAQAVGHAHARGVVHGALDPRAIRVGARGVPSLVHWYAARFAGAASATSSSRPVDGELQLPAAPYAAPELARLEPVGPDRAVTGRAIAGRTATGRAVTDHAGPRPPRASPRLDVYSLGVLLGELVSGAPQVQPGPGTAGPPGLVSVEARATAVSPSDRYADAAEMIEEVRAFLDGRVVRAHQVGTVAELRAWVRRNRGLAAIIALSITALLSFLAGLALFQVRALDRERALVDRSLLAGVLLRSAALWPPVPALLPELERVELEARRLLRELPAKRDALARRSPRAPELRASWTADEVEVATLAGSVADLEALAADTERDAHSLAGLVWRVGAARAAAARFATPPASWVAARARIRADPRFGGRAPALVPWLEPLGPDPASGLEEFAHLWTGRVPRRGADGRLRLAGDSAVVLVLLPAGSVRGGGRPAARGGASEWPAALIDLQLSELPARTAQLDVLLIGKFELTRGQWHQLTSEEREGWMDEATLLPATSLRWTECVAVLGRYGLGLPTEAQWEYACRAGAPGLWGLRDPRLELARRANLGSGRSRAVGFAADGLEGLAQVGSLEPNAFGLHDLQGNVSEWCLDSFATSQLYTIRRGDGLARTPEFGLRATRGGHFVDGPAAARVSRRNDMVAAHASGNIGVRPAMALRME